MKRIIKVIFVVFIMCSLLINSIQFAFADEFWDLYLVGEDKKNNNDLIGSIEAWKCIIDLYKNDNCEQSMTRKAVYWGNIADSYNKLGWYGEAQDAYKKQAEIWTSLGKTDSALGPNRTANRLETELKLYTKQPTTKTNKLAKYEPISGAYFGAPFDKDSEIKGYLNYVEEVYGKTHTSYLIYIQWGQEFQYFTANQAKELGDSLQIAWEPPANMSEVKYQEVYEFAKKLKDLEIPIFLRFASEMNEGSNPWGNTPPEKYKAVFSMIAKVMHKEAPNVAMVWAPNYTPIESITSYYPGDDAVDWVGIDAYTDRYYIGDPNIGTLMEDIYYQGYYANPLDKFEYIYNTYSSKKPIFIAETGVENYSNNTNEDFGKWAENNIRRLYSYIPMVYPKIKAIFYFNVDSKLVPALNMKQNYSLSNNKQVMDAYKELITNPYYLKQVGDSINYQYKPLEQVQTDSNKNIELSTYAKIIDPFISKVKYSLDGVKIGDSTKIPFTINYNLSELSQGDHILKVDVYNSNNELSARKEYTVKVFGKKVSFIEGQVKYIKKHVVLKDIEHWAKPQIEELISLWGIDGYEDGTFRPEKQISFAEFYKVLSNSLGIGLQTDTNLLKSVPSNHWSKRLLEGGVQLRIINKTELNPDKFITRGEMTELIIKAINKKSSLVEKNTIFSDDNEIPKNLKPYINEAYNLGIIEGYPDKTFKVNETATRAQAATMIVNALEYQNKDK